MKRIIAALLALLVLLSLTACGSQSATEGSSETTEATESQATEEVTETEAAPEVPELVFGNSPNNLLQSTGTMCFAEGRVFYVSADYTLCSFLLDGSDLKEHCVVSADRLVDQAPCLNYYQGGIYYMVQKESAEGLGTMEICRYDLASGTTETIHTYSSDAGRAVAKSMIIINDTLCCAYAFAGAGTTYVDTIDLTTGARNALARGNAEGGTTNFGFDSDGTYLYMIWDGGINDACMKRVLLSALFAEAPTVEELFDRPYYPQSYVLDDGGLYAAVRLSDEETIYGFYAHEALAGSVYDLTLQEIAQVAYKSYPETEAEYISNLGFDTITTDYILDGARVSVKNTYSDCLELFCSSSLDWRASVLTAELAHGVNHPTDNYHVGEYEETLYFVLEDEAGNASLHCITADGNYQ